MIQQTEATTTGECFPADLSWMLPVTIPSIRRLCSNRVGSTLNLSVDLSETGFPLLLDFVTFGGSSDLKRTWDKADRGPLGSETDSTVETRTVILLCMINWISSHTHTHKTNKSKLVGASPAQLLPVFFSFHKGKVRILEKTTNDRFPNSITARSQNQQCPNTNVNSANLCGNMRTSTCANSAAHGLDLVHRFLHFERCD